MPPLNFSVLAIEDLRSFLRNCLEDVQWEVDHKSYPNLKTGLEAHVQQCKDALQNIPTNAIGSARTNRAVLQFICFFYEDLLTAIQFGGESEAAFYEICKLQFEETLGGVESVLMNTQTETTASNKQ